MPEYIDLSGSKRFVTAVLQEEGQTFVFGWNGQSEVITEHYDVFRQLMGSIQMKSIKELAEWFRTPPLNYQRPPQRLMAAVVPDGKQVWAFEIFGPPQIVASHRERFLAFLKTVELNKSEPPKTQLEWKLPDGWSKNGESGSAAILLLGKDEEALSMMIMPLGEARPDTVSTLMDYWAWKVGLGQLSKKARKAGLKEIQISGRKAYLIDLQKPAEAFKDSEISYTIPDGWKQLPPGPIYKSSFEISQGEAAAKVSIVSLPANNNLVANVNRWGKQLELPMEVATKAFASAKPLTVDNRPGKLVELHNPNTKTRIVVAVVTQGNKDWYFKMMGDANIVEMQHKTFKDFLKTVQFIEQDAKPNP